MWGTLLICLTIRLSADRDFVVVISYQQWHTGGEEITLCALFNTLSSKIRAPISEMKNYN